ncbi:MAG: hypothetical protein CUN57_00845, partial [Phototrophicales bacterium]
MLIEATTGNVGIGDSTPDAKLDVEGDVTVSGALTLGEVFRVGNAEGAVSYNAIDDDTTVGNASGYMDASNDLYVEGQLETGGSVYVGDNLTVTNGLSVNDDDLFINATTEQVMIGTKAMSTDYMFGVDGSMSISGNLSIDGNLQVTGVSFDGGIVMDGDVQAADLYLGNNDATALFSTVDTNEDLTIDPNGTGDIYYHGAT